MLKYILKRILIFIPTLIIITLLGFIISVNAPGDPVERMVSSAESGGEMGSQSFSQEKDKIFWRHKLGLDLPVFYFSLTSYSRPDTLYKISDKNEQRSLDRLIDTYGNWQEIQNYNSSLNLFYSAIINLSIDTTAFKEHSKDSVSEDLNQLRFHTLTLKASYEDKIITTKFKTIHSILSSYSFQSSLKNAFTTVTGNYQKIKSTSTTWKNYIPRLAFYKHNQYHRWLFGDEGSFSKGLFRGDFGTSYITRQPVSDVIFSKIGWSMFFALLSIILAYLISIPLGVKAAADRNSGFDKGSSLIFFILYSMPSFWLATLLLMTFANTDLLFWFPASGVKPAIGYPETAGFLEKIKLSVPYIILPLICYTYSSIAFLSRTMRVSMIEIVKQDYIRTAHAKGLSKKQVIWKHAFRNSLLPIITVFANIFPAVIGGSVIIESIFTIPGMGSEAVFAIQNNNYPMIIAILTITGFLTLVGYLISDILYTIADPRISYN